MLPVSPFVFIDIFKNEGFLSYGTACARAFGRFVCRRLLALAGPTFLSCFEPCESKEGGG